MSRSIQFLSYYLHGLSVSLYILSESKIHKLSFHPANPHPLPLLVFFPRIQILSHVYFNFLTPSVSTSISEYVEQVWAQVRSFVQPHTHAECVAFASCNSRTLVSQPQYNALYQFNIGPTFWYDALPRAPPDLLHRYCIVCLGMKIAFIAVLLLGMNPNYSFHEFTFLQWAVSDQF